MESYPPTQSYKRKYSSREVEIRAELTQGEVIRRIREIYLAEYNPDLDYFDAYDQLLACEAVAGATPVRDNYYKEDKTTNGNVSVNENGNDGSKPYVNFDLTQNKLEIITKLKNCNYRTAPLVISQLLEEFFKEWPSKQGWWLYVTQHWTPKSINSVFYQMIKMHNSGSTTFINPPGYFTYLIKLHPKKSVFRHINDTYKQQL